MWESRADRGMAKIHIVGAGPGSPDYVIPAARKVVQKAAVVIGAERALNLFSEDIKGEKIVLTARNFQEVLNKAIKLAENGLEVTFISTGDPCFSGLLKTFSRLLGEEADINVIPGISSVQVCAAKLKISWDEAAIISFHEGVNEHKKRELAQAGLAGKPLIILPDLKTFPPREIARFLMGEGIVGESLAYICENLTLDDERIIQVPLEAVESLDHKSLCVMVVKPLKRDEV